MEAQQTTVVDVALAILSFGSLLVIISALLVRRLRAALLVRAIKERRVDMRTLTPTALETLTARQRSDLRIWAARMRVEADHPAAPPAPAAPASPAPATELPPLETALAHLPCALDLAHLPHPPAPTSIPLGVDPAGQLHWLDLAGTTLHIGIYGQSGCGKDSLLRTWFAVLTHANEPHDLQIAILDGKGDWLLGGLRDLAHMAFPPAGGYGRAGDARIAEAVAFIDAEAERRQRLITTAGCRTREEYCARTGAAMPLLVVVATDVMTSVAGDVERLLEQLVSKARSLGIRVIVSMQTPTGRSTRWRMNLSTVVAGCLQSGSQDEPALGLPPASLSYRPSQLPAPEPARPETLGLFVVRRGGTQLLIKAPYLAEAAFDAICAGLPRRSAPVRPGPETLLGTLLSAPLPDAIRSSETPADAEPEPTTAPSPAATVSDVERALITSALRRGAAPGVIAKGLPGYSGRRYRDYLAKVEAVRDELEVQGATVEAA